MATYIPRRFSEPSISPGFDALQPMQTRSCPSRVSHDAAPDLNKRKRCRQDEDLGCTPKRRRHTRQVLSSGIDAGASVKGSRDQSPDQLPSPALTRSGQEPTHSSSGTGQHKRVKPCVNNELASTIAGPHTRDDCDTQDQITADPIAYWTLQHCWPDNFATISQKESGSSKKRPPSSSYSQSYRAGEVPKAHTRAYEHELAKNNVFMDETKGRVLVKEESRLLCERLLQKLYPEPEHTSYPLPRFVDVWQRVQYHNETRLFRDITAVLVPSPELLYIAGHQELEHVAETLSVEWRKVKALGGPNPKPDQVIGLTESAFDNEQVAKLQNHTSFERATLFGEMVYFPFLIIEAKCGEDGINKADRQNMHSSSIALNAILQLYLALDDGRGKAAAFNGEVLLFSISHDNKRVKLFGHFAIVEKDKISFYRYYFDEFVLNIEARQGRKRTHDFVRAVYDVFYPSHLARIQRALAQMQDPRTVSMKSKMSIGEADSQDASVALSQDTTHFKKPYEPASSKQKSEIELLREQLTEQRRQMEQQRKESEQQQKELMDMLKQQSEQIKLLVQRQE